MTRLSKSEQDYISVIIPNYNGIVLLEKNLPKVVEAANNRKNHILEIIVVDDASTDLSVDFIKKSFPKIRLIRHRINRGFPASVNTGARSAKGDFLVLLNTDVVPSKTFLESVIPHFGSPDVFAVSLHEESFAWARGKFENGFIVHESGPESNHVHESFWVSGGSGVFRRDLWMKLNGMDEKLFSPFYWEDVDICYRASKRGWINLWDPHAKVLHQHESTVVKLSKRFRERIQERNQLIFIWKNLTSSQLFRKHLAGLMKRIVQHPGYILIVLMTILKCRKILRSRRKEKKEEKVSDEAIFAKFADLS